ncbi:MAG: ribosome biogenesis GTPase Der [Thermacetogeniaceae bacterium]|nr:ribosome biogenesis GTPase Der [Syntrophomonadaceae bacterium]
MKKPVVALVGRPNVGKSTLFNRLSGGRTAIVADRPGVTRDRLYRDVEWDGRSFTLVDTGGLFLEDEQFHEHVAEQVAFAIEDADVVVFVVDAKVGVTVEDKQVAQLLLKSKKKVILAANKVDNFKNQDVYDLYQLGLGEPLPISSLHGLNIDELLDQIISLLPEMETQEEETGIRVAVVGRPNVGKSSLVNALLKEKRVIVSDVPGTTRDAIDTKFSVEDRSYTLVDTAGIRRRSRVERGVEYYGVRRALKAIDRADVVLLVLNAAEGIVEQDKKIAGYIEESGKGVIIILNKWDLVADISNRRHFFENLVREQLPFLSYAPILYISALTGEGLKKILPLVDAVHAEQNKMISTGNLNSWLSEALFLNPPPSTKGGLKVFYVTQVAAKPPVFVFFVNNTKLVHFSYKRYLENQLREAYGFEGTPVRLKFKARRRRDQ